MVCGLPQTENPHPKAGIPAYINTVGTSYGCLPCAEIPANFRDTSKWSRKSHSRLQELVRGSIRGNPTFSYNGSREDP